VKRQRKGGRTEWRAVLALGLLAALAVGCMHTPVPIPPQPIEGYAFRQGQAGVRVAVDPYFTLDRLKLAFTGGEDFPKNGLLPVRVIIENGSGGEVQVSPRNFRLVRRDGSSDIALSVQDALAAVKVSMGWWALGAPVGAGAIPALQNEGRQKSLEARALQETKILAGGSASGFVYFYLPESEKTLAGDQIVFALTGGDDKELTFEIPIDGRREFLAPEAKPAEVAEPPKPVIQTPLDPQNPQSPTRVEGAGGGVIIRSPAR
jgi:hypothetical protein